MALHYDYRIVDHGILLFSDPPLLPPHCWPLCPPGGATEPGCPYRCISSKYSMPHCNTPLEDLVHDLGGPWVFSLICSASVLMLAFTISLARTKLLLSSDDLSTPPARNPEAGMQNDHTLPFLESLTEVREG